MAPRPKAGAALPCQAGESPFSGEQVLDQWHLWVIFEGVKARQRGQLWHSALGRVRIGLGLGLGLGLGTIGVMAYMVKANWIMHVIGAHGIGVTGCRMRR